MSQVEVWSGAVDRGLEGVVACSTAISTIEDVTLNYRGYTIEDLAENATFEEVIYLLWYDRLPSHRELIDFKTQLITEARVSEGLLDLLSRIPHQGVHPMTWLRTATSLLAHVDPDAAGMSEEENRRKALRISAKMGSLVTALNAFRSGRKLLDLVPDKSLAWNFLHRLTGCPPSERHARIFDVCLILHADHELNCSAFAARVTASSLSDIHSAVVSAIGALKGPLHGGANEQVLVMLQKIGSVEKAQQFVKDALAAKEKVMGIGHRVYKNGDPRAKILQKFSEELTREKGLEYLYKISLLIDETMYKEKGLMPNVDFYSATVYHCLGIPTDLFTPIFAASRVVGWCAHILEQYGKNRIYRPRGQWVGKKGLKWIPLDCR